MRYDLVVQGGTVVTAGGIFHTDVGVAEGQIAALGARLEGRDTIPAAGMLVLPGGVDPHVHLEMPTPTTVTSDDWATGTRAAACGGTTTVIDFVEPEAGQSLLAAFELRRRQAERGAAIDFSLHMTITQADQATLAQIPAVVQAGMSSFKVYTTYPGFALGDEGLLEVFAAVAEAGGLAMVHAENDAILRHRLGRQRQAGQLRPQDYPASRPAVAEVEAIRRTIVLARYTGVPLYVVHVSTLTGGAAVERARQHGQAVFGETCPQYLLLDETCFASDDPRQAVRFICAPPLRAAKDRQGLWAQLQAGGLQTVGSDHCAFCVEGQKDRGLADFTQAPGGLPGVEARLALLYTFGVRAGRLTAEQWVERCCTAPARIFGLYPRKGSLEIGADADLVVFDPRQTVRLSTACLHENVDYTPYAGLELTGWPVLTLARGVVVARAGRFTGRAGHGRYLAAAPIAGARPNACTVFQGAGNAVG